MVRVITWNMGGAHGPYKKRHADAWGRLLGLEPDVALVQECIPPGDLPAGWAVHVEPYQFWASAIVTRVQLEPISLELTSHLGRFGSYLALARVRLDDASLIVGSVHARSAEASSALLRGLDGAGMARGTVGVPWWNDVAWHGLADLVRGERFVMGGDWNTSRWVDRDGTPDPVGQEFFDRATADGWVDIHQALLGREERSWFGTVGERDHQPDVVFADLATARLATTAFVMQAVARDERLSDHAPLVVEMEVDRG